MKNNTVIDLDNPEEIDALTELLRTGAKTLIAESIQAELDEQLLKFEDQITAGRRQRGVRSGYHPEREIVTVLAKSASRCRKSEAGQVSQKVFSLWLYHPTFAGQQH